MQYIWKLLVCYDSNKWQDLSQYLTAPVFLELRCNEQLSTGEVILDSVPKAEYPKPFPPKTKIILERWVGKNLDKSWDYVVDHDDVENYTGAPEICCHRIHLIEPSVIAQGMHPDNIALTYELNDVNLNYKTVVPSNETVNVKVQSIAGAGMVRPNPTVWRYGGEIYLPLSGVRGWYDGPYGDVYYTNSFIYQWSGLDEIENLKLNLNALEPHDISFEMPVLKCYWNTESVAQYLFDCPVRCTITQYTLQNGKLISQKVIKSQLYSPSTVEMNSGTENRNDVMYIENGLVGLCGIKEGERTRKLGSGSQDVSRKVFTESEITKFPAMINLEESQPSRTVIFTTQALSETQLQEGLSYEYRVSFVIEPYQQGAFISQYTAKTTIVYEGIQWWERLILKEPRDVYKISYTNYVAPSPTSCSVSCSFYCRNMLVGAPNPSPFLIKGRPYNCYDLLRKALLTCDTYIINNAITGLDERYDNEGNNNGIQYPIDVHSDWKQILKETIMHESVFEAKNLWEIIQQIGHYLHAVPKLEFSRDDTDRLILNFKKLGSTSYANDSSIKITVFNSQTLENYFAQFDAYITNLFSPQNEIDEWLVCKTSDSSYLVSNETAELQTKYNITEIIEFDIIYKGEKKSALDYIFEESIYNTLSSRTSYTPAKWSALYYKMGTNKILGLNYVPPSDGATTVYMALKTIVGKLFNNGVTDANLLFNELKFHIRYKTQDSLRINQIRPDLESFIRNSKLENYPHHEQFFGQQDKIVDSERLSANLWGRLVRVANGIYQRQEYAELGQEKEPGDLVDINGEPYYITECENEYYPNAIFQKVTYSKNFNQLANIVTIPSEPRFYEISERAMIRREVRLLDFIKLTTLPNPTPPSPKFIHPEKWHTYIRNLIFADNGNVQHPNFAYTNFKADVWRYHHNLPNNDVSILFPSSEAEIVDGVYQPKPSSSNRAVIVPLLFYPMRNAIVYEWDMEDNFKAGDCRDFTVTGSQADIVDKAYQALQAVRYTDAYGRADLFDFKLFYKDDWTLEQACRLPFAEAESGDFIPSLEESLVLVPDNLAIGLDKDNREALSFNYQLNLLHSPHEDDEEDFVLFSNIFGKKNGRLKCALLNNTVSMFNENVRIDVATIVADNITYIFLNQPNKIKIDFIIPANIDLTAIKSIIFYDEDSSSRYAILAKNVENLPNDKKLQSWWIYPVFNEHS